MSMLRDLVMWDLIVVGWTASVGAMIVGIFVHSTRQARVPASVRELLLRGLIYYDQPPAEERLKIVRARALHESRTQLIRAIVAIRRSRCGCLPHRRS